MHQNVSLESNGVDRVRSLRKIPTRLRGTNFCTSSGRFAPSSVSQPNSPKCTQIVQTNHNINLVSNGVDRLLSLRKIMTRLRGTNFCIDSTSSAHFEPSFVRRLNGPERTQTQINAPEYEFRVQWGGLEAFVTKNSNTIS